MKLTFELIHPLANQKIIQYSDYELAVIKNYLKNGGDNSMKKLINVPFGLLFEETLNQDNNTLVPVYDEIEDISYVVTEDVKVPYVEYCNGLGTKTATKTKDEDSDSDDNITYSFIGTKTMTCAVEQSDEDDDRKPDISKTGTRTVTATSTENSDSDN